MFLSAVNFLLLLAVLGGLAVLHRKIARIDQASKERHRLTRAELRDEITSAESRVYFQLESLQALKDLLKLDRPLPPLRGWAGSPDFLLQLAKEVLARRPATVVECSSGASTLVAARCCQLNGAGHVYSLEHGPEFADQTRRLITEAGLGDWATVLDAPLEPVSLAGESYPWYSLAKLPTQEIDLLVVDGPPGDLRPQSRYPAGPMLVPRLSISGVILVDDADREDERRIVERWSAEFPALEAGRRSAEKGLVVLSRSTASPA